MAGKIPLAFLQELEVTISTWLESNPAASANDAVNFAVQLYQEQRGVATVGESARQKLANVTEQAWTVAGRGEFRPYRRSFDFSTLQIYEDTGDEPSGKPSTPTKKAGRQQKAYRGEKGRFLHHRFAELLLNEYDVATVDGNLVVWDETQGRFFMGDIAVAASMQRIDHALTRNQRQETLSTLRLLAPVREMASPNEILFSNGILDLSTGKQFPSTHNHVNPNLIPHRFNPNASCPELDEALDTWACGSAERRLSMLEAAGLCLYHGRDLGVCILLLGKGGHGKSTFLKLLRATLGDENVSSLDIGRVGRRFQSVALVGKLANIGDDVSSEYIDGDSMATLRSAITCDVVSAEYKGGATFSFRPYATHVFACNRMPRMKDDTSAVYRRFVPIPFEADFTQGNRDPRIESTLTTERAIERFIVLAVDALRGCIERGGMTDTSERAAIIHGMRRGNSSVYAFATDVLGFGGSSPESLEGISVPETHDRYCSYCGGAQLRAVSRNAFTQDICELYDLRTKNARVGLRGPDGRKAIVRIFCRKEG